MDEFYLDLGKKWTGLINLPPPSDAVRKQKKKYFRGSLQISIVTIKKNITPWET